MGNPYVDKDVLDILSDMLIEYQIHKENDDVITENNSVSDDEDVEIDIIVTHVCVINNHDEKRKFASKGKKDHEVEDVEKDVETLREYVVSNDESIFMGCVVDNKVYRLYTMGTQSINDVLTKMTPP